MPTASAPPSIGASTFPVAPPSWARPFALP
jgi:hypothetical protein